MKFEEEEAARYACVHDVERREGGREEAFVASSASPSLLSPFPLLLLLLSVDAVGRSSVGQSATSF